MVFLLNFLIFHFFSSCKKRWNNEKLIQNVTLKLLIGNTVTNFHKKAPKGSEFRNHTLLGWVQISRADLQVFPNFYIFVPILIELDDLGPSCDVPGIYSTTRLHNTRRHPYVSRLSLKINAKKSKLWFFLCK